VPGTVRLEGAEGAQKPLRGCACAEPVASEPLPLIRYLWRIYQAEMMRPRALE